MSHVTNVLLHVGILEEVTLEEINSGSSEQEGQTLQDLSWGSAGELWGGHKWPETKLSAAAFNYLRREALMAHLSRLSWTCPEDVQLFIKGQGDEKFTVYQLVAREWVELIPASRVLDT